MANLYAVLGLLSLVALLTGLFRPRLALPWSQRPTRGRASLLYGLGLVTCLYLLGNSDEARRVSAEHERRQAAEADTVLQLTKAQQQAMAADYEARYQVQAQEEARDRAARTVTASALREGYRRNPAAAASRYTGRSLFVTGPVAGVEQDEAGKQYVSLSGDQVRCYYDNADIAGGLRNGQLATFEGVCRGRQGWVRLDSCRLVVD